MDNGALLVGRSKGLGGLMLLVVGGLWLASNYGYLTDVARWAIPGLVILLAIKMIAQSTLFARSKQ